MVDYKPAILFIIVRERDGTIDEKVYKDIKKKKEIILIHDTVQSVRTEKESEK